MSCPVARRELSIQILTEPNPHRCNPRETDSTWGPQTDTWSGSQARLPRRKASVWTLIKGQDLGTPCGVEDLTAVVCAGSRVRREEERTGEAPRWQPGRNGWALERRKRQERVRGRARGHRRRLRGRPGDCCTSLFRTGCRQCRFLTQPLMVPWPSLNQGGLAWPKASPPRLSQASPGERRP